MSADNRLKELTEKVDSLEEAVNKMKRYYDEVLESLDESNFSKAFLQKIKNTGGAE